jgi:hypothetical protein
MLEAFVLGGHDINIFGLKVKFSPARVSLALGCILEFGMFGL